jgi:hypothetical protein
MACVRISLIYFVFCLWYQVLDGISKCIICNNNELYNTL